MLNPDKTKLMVFGSQQMICKLPSFKLSFLGKELLPTNSVKDLGVVFDPTLSFDSHITALAATCISRLAQINRAKHAFNPNLLVNIINALVFSRLFYCSTVWSNTSDKNLRKLQHVQNFAARIISGKRKFDHITPVLRDLRWLTVTQQLYLRDAVFTFKCMTGCAPDYLRSKLVTRGQASGRVTRNSQQLNIPLFRTATGQRSFQYRAVSLWNSLDKDLKLSKNHEVLKCKLKHILRDTIYRLSIGNFLPFMDHSYIIYILIYIIFHFKRDVLITEKPLRGVFNKVLSYLDVFTNTTLNRLGFGMLTMETAIFHWLYF